MILSLDMAHHAPNGPGRVPCERVLFLLFQYRSTA